MELKEESEEVAWIDHELHQRQAFVLDQDRELFEYHHPQMEEEEQQEENGVVYRRAAFGSTLVTSSHFDSMMTENFYEPQASKISFSSCPSGPSSSSPIFQHTNKSTTSSTSPMRQEYLGTMPSLSSSLSRQLPPVIEDDQVLYHQVHPTFESNVNAFKTFEMLQKALQSNKIEFTNNDSSSNSFSCGWHFNAFAVVFAEEIHFTIQLKRLLNIPESPIRVDFYLRQGDEQIFLQLTDCLRFNCRSIDKELQNLPAMSHGLFHYHHDDAMSMNVDGIDSSGGDGSSTMDISDKEEFELLLTDLEMELTSTTTTTSTSTTTSTTIHRRNVRNCFYLVKQFKDICLSKANRWILVSNETLSTKLIHVLHAILFLQQDEQEEEEEEDILRFGLFILVLFFDTNRLLHCHCRRNNFDIGNDGDVSDDGGSGGGGKEKKEKKPIILLDTLVNRLGGKKQLEKKLEQLLQNNCLKKCTKQIAQQLYQILK